MPITMIRPLSSMNVISMFITTDSVMPMKLITTRAATNTSDTSSAGGPSHSSAKYEAKPVARDPVAAKLAERKETVTRKVSALLLKAFWTYSEEPAACGYLVTSSAYAAPVMAATATPTAKAIQNAPPTAAATRPIRT